MDGFAIDSWLSALWLESLWWTFGLFFVVSLTEMLFPPFPGDTVYFVGLVAVQAGGHTVTGALIAAFLGGFVGYVTLFWLGRTKGRRLFGERKRGLLSLAALKRAEGWFGRWGGMVIVLGRFIAGIRSVIPLTAGVSGYPVVRAMVFGAVSIVLWNGLLATAALILHESWETVAKYWQTYSLAVWLVAGVALAYFGWRTYRRRRQAGS